MVRVKCDGVEFFLSIVKSNIIEIDKEFKVEPSIYDKIFANSHIKCNYSLNHEATGDTGNLLQLESQKLGGFVYSLIEIEFKKNINQEPKNSKIIVIKENGVLFTKCYDPIRINSNLKKCFISFSSF